MPSHHQGWAYLIDRWSGDVRELFNEARTLDGLEEAVRQGDVHGFYDIGTDTICESYRYVPVCPGVPAEAVFGLPDADGNEAPWYDDEYPASADAYGFIVEEWTGLDGAHVVSTSTPIGYAGGGSYAGPRNSSGRTMSINVLLIGRSDEGLEHLFRWLEGTLNSVCDPAATTDMLIRRFCPEFVSIIDWWGIAKLEKVSTIASLTWQDAPASRGECRVRRANFTIEAGDPCMYVDHEVVAAAGNFLVSDDDNDDLAFDSPLPRCADAANYATTLEYVYQAIVRPSVGVVAPVVRMRLQASDEFIHGGPILMQVYAAPDTSGLFSCQLPLLAEIGIRAIDETERVSALTVVYDGARRDVFEETPGSSPMASGWSWVTPTGSGYPRFAARQCTGYFIALMPLAPADFDPPPEVDIFVTLGERISCP